MYVSRVLEGTRVRVIQGIRQSNPAYRAETLGVVEACYAEPTGAWFVHGRNGKLWLQRLRLRKADGALSVLTIDGQTRVQTLEPGEDPGHDPPPQ